MNSGLKGESQTRRVETKRLSSVNRGERVEYLGEVSRTETGRRESVVRGEPTTKTTVSHNTHTTVNTNAHTHTHHNVNAHTHTHHNTEQNRLSSGNQVTTVTYGNNTNNSGNNTGSWK